MTYEFYDLRKAASSLAGILRGIAADGAINQHEGSYIRNWLDSHDHIIHKPAFAEVGQVVYNALQDGIIDDEEKQDILWVCDKYLANNLGYDDVSDGLRELHGILGGITADGKISVQEVQSLQAWINQNDYLKGSWPYDEVETLVSKVMEDGVITDQEHELMMAFFSEFVAMADDQTITHPMIINAKENRLECLIQTNPELTFPGQTYCFTGKSARAERSEIASMIQNLGGTFNKGISRKINFLVIGCEGSQCWQYACYGRKIEQAVLLRKQGHPIQIIHEIDFWDAV